MDGNIVLFFNGEVVLTAEQFANTPVDYFIIRFGDTNFTVRISDIQLYDVAASTKYVLLMSYIGAVVIGSYLCIWGSIPGKCCSFLIVCASCVLISNKILDASWVFLD